MTRQALLDGCCSLHKQIEESAYYQAVCQAEQSMLQDDYIQLFIQYYQTAQGLYQDGERFQVDNMNELTQKLSQAKERLYQQEKVQNYLKSLSEFNHLLDHLQATLFAELTNENRSLTIAYREKQWQKER